MLCIMFMQFKCQCKVFGGFFSLPKLVGPRFTFDSVVLVIGHIFVYNEVNVFMCSYLFAVKLYIHLYIIKKSLICITR